MTIHKNNLRALFSITAIVGSALSVYLCEHFNLFKIDQKMLMIGAALFAIFARQAWLAIEKEPKAQSRTDSGKILPRLFLTTMVIIPISMVFMLWLIYNL